MFQAHDHVAADRIALREGAKLHLLVVDVILPEKNGAQVVSAIRRRTPDVRVLYISGYTAQDIASRGVDLELSIAAKAVLSGRNDQCCRAGAGLLIQGAVALIGLILVLPYTLHVYALWCARRRPVGDVVVVPGCRVYANGEISVAFQRRIRKAVEVMHVANADRLLITGGHTGGLSRRQRRVLRSR